MMAQSLMMACLLIHAYVILLILVPFCGMIVSCLTLYL